MASDAGERAQTWLHEETGVVAISRVVAAQAGQPGEYRLVLTLRDGRRCGAAMAIMALADFGMLHAQMATSSNRSERCFTLAWWP